ncbi:MAG: hypothetical protein IKP20_09075, partial [Candidatus Methanomethylophilaceae archaeon]|nr:hypothetical protein [Candidatus Methanomethylophilaceae archaeon]
IYCPELIPPHKEASVSHTFGRHFNELQMRAINGAVFANGFYMIQGPPGTGKTQVIAEIAAQEVIRGHKVLIASQGNKAVDNAFERLRPYSFIRPVRIMAEKKESEYELKNIVSTFYGGICKAVEDRMDLFGDPERRAEIDGKISEFRAFYKDSYAPKKAEAEPTIRKVRALRKDLNDRLYKISCDNAALESSRRRYEAMCGRLGRLGDFERDDYRDYASKILSLFEGIGAHDRDSVVFGPDGLCSAIASISEDDLYDTIERYEGFRDAGTLPNDALSLMFAEGMPNSIPKIKNALEEIQEIVRREAEAERDEAEKASRYDPKDEDEARSLYGAKMDTYASNPAYAEYLEAERHLHGIVSELFSLMKVTDRYETMDEARRIVDKEAKVLDAFSGMNLRETMAACRDIDGYLRTESVAGIDSDQLIDELSSCVNVVGMTCTAREIASRSNAREFPEIDLRKMGIDVAIIDEVSKVPFPELIRPMSYAKKVILVGDHKQLPPVYNERAEDDTMEELNAKYARMYSEPLFMSMFDRASEDSKTMLKTQYRMTSQIMGVINRFYGGALEMPEGIPERSHRMRIDGRTRPLITPEHSVLFIDCKGKERREGGSTSFVNDAEADAVAKLVKLLDSRCRCDSFGNPLGSERSVPMSMGVITPYADQIRSIKRILRMDGRNGFRLRSFRNDGEERFMVKSVDDFQGDERDVIIVSLVRTTKSKFISDFRRINVAMSRARRLLIIVGDADSLGKVSVDLDGNGRYSNAYQDIISDLKLADCFADASEIPEAAE